MIMPKYVAKYLVSEEVVEKEYYLRGRLALRGYRVYASNKRLFIVRGNSIRDIDYNHVSSIELKQELDWALVALGGGVCAICGLLFWLELGFWWAPAVLGVALLILGLTRTQSMELVVVGFAGPLKLSGHRSQLDSLLRLVREKSLGGRRTG